MDDESTLYDLTSLDFVAEEEWGAQLRGPHLLRVHPASACADDPNCCIHKPSDHHMREWPMNWRADRGLMERICPDGTGHPDPDALAHIERIGGDADSEGVHGCDGCCRER